MEPLRCPHCQALVVDRRFPQCTTCHADLPADWVLSPAQVSQIEANDRSARAEHDSTMKQLDQTQPDSDLIP